jgi:transposase
MTDVCGEFGISRKTGYKILSRYESEGANAVSSQDSHSKTVAMSACI